jgi:outer membrane protein TolC
MIINHFLSKKIVKSLLIVFFYILYGQNVFAQNKTLTQDDILKTTAQFYPEILGALQKIKASKAQINRAEGAFDTVISQDLYTRPDGFYDGNYLNTQIEQPIPEWNAKFYSGYRIADGTFPIYENYWETDNSGEYYIGAKISLLRDRIINKKTTAISVSELGVIEEKTKLVLQQLNIQKNAIQKYWAWVTAGHQYKVYQDLLELAQMRQKNIEQQVSHGNLAAVYLQENEQYILKRKADLNMAQAVMAMTAQDLSLYYRNQNGHPIEPNDAMLPKKMPDILDNIIIYKTLNNVSNHPVFKILDTQKTILTQKKLLSENDLLPYLDFNVKAAQDLGSGSKTRDEGELQLYLNMTLPLQRTVAKSDKTIIDAKLTELNYKEQMQLDKLRLMVKNLLTNMNNQKQYLQVTAREYELATQMSKIEEDRFKSGISDFFTLNKREEDMMKIRLQRLKAQESYLKMHAEIKALTAQLDPIFDTVL